MRVARLSGTDPLPQYSGGAGLRENCQQDSIQPVEGPAEKRTIARCFESLFDPLPNCYGLE